MFKFDSRKVGEENWTIFFFFVFYKEYKTYEKFTYILQSFPRDTFSKNQPLSRNTGHRSQHPGIQVSLSLRLYLNFTSTHIHYRSLSHRSASSEPNPKFFAPNPTHSRICAGKTQISREIKRDGANSIRNNQMFSIARMKSSTNQIHSNPSYSIGKNYEYNRVAKVKKEKTKKELEKQQTTDRGILILFS